MTDKAYHDEAKRKTRVIERKRLAQERLSNQYGGEISGSQETYLGTGHYTENRNTNAMAISHSAHPLGRSYQVAQYDHSREGPVRDDSWRMMLKQIRHEEKVLRDHNIVMGPTSAFLDMFTTKDLSGRKY